MKSKIQRILAVALSVTAAGTFLSACSTAGTAGGSSDKKELTIGVLSAKPFDPCIGPLTKKYTEDTGVPVKMVVLPYSSMRDKFLSAFNAGSNDYDIVTMAFQWTGEFAAPGFLRPIDEYAKNNADWEKFDNQSVASYEYEGKHYAVPYQGNAMMMYYRKDILETLGVQPPKTYEELGQISERIKTDARFAGVSPVSVMGDRSQSFANWANRYYSLGGGNVADDNGNPNIDVDLAAKAMELYKRDIENSPAGALRATFAEPPQQFAAGKAAFVESFGGSQGNLYDVPSETNKVLGKVGAITIPGGHGDRGGWGFAVTSTTPQPEEAFKLASFLSSPENDIKCAVEAGKGPVVTETAKSSKVTKVYDWMPTAAAALSGSKARFSGPNAGAQNDTVDEYVNLYTSGQISDSRETAQRMVAALKTASK